MRARLVGAVAVLVVLDVVGGVIAIATDVNTAGEAWSGDAKLDAPWPMILLQIVLTALAVSRWRRVAIAAAVLLFLACAVSAISGFFDGSFAADELGAGHVVFQVVLIAWTALVAVLAALLAVELAAAERGDRQAVQQ